jgi:hypothetical protein
MIKIKNLLLKMSDNKPLYKPFKSKKEEKILDKEDEILKNVEEPILPTPKLERKDSMVITELQGPSLETTLSKDTSPPSS